MGETMQINQIIWAIDNKNQIIVPLQIVEKVTKETAAGVKTEFVVQSVDGKKFKLSAIEGNYFEKSADAYNHLLATAQKFIENIVTQAEEMAQTFQNVEKKAQTQVQTDSESDTMYQEEPPLVKLPDGRQARVRVVQ
jgi:hypothetical protein